MGILDKLKDTFGYESVDSKRTASNKKVLDVLAIEDDMGKFVKQQAENTSEVNRLVHITRAQWERDVRAQYTAAQLFLDRWCQMHGPIVTQADVDAAKKAGVTKDKLPVENWSEARRQLKKYGRMINTKLAAKREAAEFRQMQGPLAEFEDLETSMGDLPSTADIAGELIKIDPELKKYRKNLV